MGGVFCFYFYPASSILATEGGQAVEFFLKCVSWEHKGQRLIWIPHWHVVHFPTKWTMLTPNPFIYTLSLYLHLLLLLKAFALWFLLMVRVFIPFCITLGSSSLKIWWLGLCLSVLVSLRRRARVLTTVHGSLKGDHVALKFHGDFVCLLEGAIAFIIVPKVWSMAPNIKSQFPERSI